MFNICNFRRKYARTYSFHTLFISVIAVVLYVFVLQLIADLLSQVFSSNSHQEDSNHGTNVKRLTFINHDSSKDNKNGEKEFEIIDNDDEESKDVRRVKERINDNEYIDDEKEFDILNYNGEIGDDSGFEGPEIDYRIGKSSHRWHTQDSIIERTKDCSQYFKKYPVLYFDKVIRKYEEENLKPAYSLAFSHLVHKEIAIYEAFLSMYFRPNDFYCIHVDKESSEKVWKAVKGLAKCYSTKMNHGKIIIIDKNDSFKVRWGQDQMLKADLRCIDKLLQLRKENKSPWRYSISMAGSELPLVTYASMHSLISKKLKENDSSLESFRMPNYQLSRRLKKKAHINCTVCPNDDKAKERNRKWKDTVPLEYSFVNPLDKDSNYKIQVFKGLRSVVLSAKDAEFMVNHPVSKQIYNWFDKCSMTEEHYYSSLIRMIVDPKTLVVSQNTKRTREDILHGLCIRYTHWYYGVRMGGKTYKRKACFGNFHHAICNFNLFDIQKLKEASEKCLIGNKFSLDIDSLAVVVHWSNIVSESFQQAGDKHFSKTIKQYVNGNERNFSSNYYERMMKIVNS